MAGKGGYQAPSKPANSSGPGSLSQRTDGGPASKQAQRYISGMPNYGDGQELALLQKQAPLSASPGAKPMTPAQVSDAAQAATQPGTPTPAAGPVANPVTPITLDQATQLPNQPVTHGAAAGPGAGPESLILPSQTQNQYQSAYQMFQNMAQRPDASEGLKYLAQRIQRGF